MAVTVMVALDHFEPAAWPVGAASEASEVLLPTSLKRLSRSLDENAYTDTYLLWILVLVWEKSLPGQTAFGV